MSSQQATFDLDNIDDPVGIKNIIKALENIDGVESAEIMPDRNQGVVRFDDTKTSIHAIKAAVNMVDYVTQPFPEDAPQNPNNDSL